MSVQSKIPNPKSEIGRFRRMCWRGRIGDQVKVLIVLAALLLALGSAEAQQAKKSYRIGLITLGYFAPSQVEAFRDGMRELGYDGTQKELIVDVRSAQGELTRLSDLVTKLLGLKVDAMVSNSTEAIQIVAQRSPSMPIVMSSISDPLGSGLVKSLANPGGNITGLSLYSTDLAGKRLELLKETIPAITNVAVMVLRDHSPTPLLLEEMLNAAQALQLKITPVVIGTPGEYQKAFSTIGRQRQSALFVQNNTVFHQTFAALTRLASKYGIPTMGPSNAFAAAGGLIAYGPNVISMWRRTAFFVDKILKGFKPADLPVEQPTKFELVINLKTAKQIGLTIPPHVLARADRVIR